MPIYRLALTELASVLLDASQKNIKLSYVCGRTRVLHLLCILTVADNRIARPLA